MYPKENGNVNNVSKWNKVYQQDPAKIPWNFEKVPSWFQEIIESGWVKPCATLDVGCGLGNYSYYLATKGFHVLGIDFSQEAVSKNKRKYRRHNLSFQVCNALNLRSLGKSFDFVIDISLFHHIHPLNRTLYAHSLANVTEIDRKVLLCCFSINDELFEGKSEFYGPDTDTVTYVLTEKEIRDTFQGDFIIESMEELAYGKPAKFKNSIIRKRHLVKMTRK